MSYTYGVLYLSRSINTRLDQRISEPLMYTQFVETVDSGKACSLTVVASGKGQGWAEVGAVTPFSLELCFIFTEFSEK